MNIQDILRYKLKKVYDGKSAVILQKMPEQYMRLKIKGMAFRKMCGEDTAGKAHLLHMLVR